MNKEFNKKEIDILKNEIVQHLEDMKTNIDDYDADTIGTEIEYSKKMIHSLDVLSYISDNIEDDGTAVYMNGLFSRLIREMPLTPLESNKNRPNEWSIYGDSINNKRYLYLYGVYSDELKDYLYHDLFRFEFYDILKNKKVHTSDLPKGRIERYLDRLIPIEFPYDPDTDHIKIYIELFECTLQDGHEPVTTLGLTHWMDGVSEKPNKIFRFFDISEDSITEIDWHAYSTRRQIYDNTIEISVEGGTDNENSEDEQQ